MSRTVLKVSQRSYVENLNLIFKSECLILEPSNRCNFLLKKREGMTKLYTMRQSGVVTALDCQHVCLETMPTESCRHFTFDIDSRTCYTSHVTSAQARIYHGNSLISYNKESLESGDIDDCVDCK